jgi:hypothetical protein
MSIDNGRPPGLMTHYRAATILVDRAQTFTIAYRLFG